MEWLEAIPIVGQAVQAGVDMLIAKKNLTFQEQNLDYQKAMQREAWMREDTASQRKMADLKAAGLNPLLAYGMQAQSSGPIRTEAPQMEQIQPAVKMAQGVQNALNLMQQKANIEKTYAEKSAIDMQMRKTAVEAETMERMKEDNIETMEVKNEMAQVLDWLIKQNELSISENERERGNQEVAYNEWKQWMTEGNYIKLRRDIEMRGLELGLKKQEQDVLLKTVERLQKEHDYGIYEFIGQPSNQAWGQNLGNLVKSTAGLVGDVWKDLQSKIRGQ